MYIAIVIFAVILFYVWSLYNKFVSGKTRIKASIQEIGNQLKRQADLIPNLVETAKGYLKHEKGIFDELTKARKSVVSATEKGDLQKMVDASENVNRALTPLFVLVESNPELKGVESVSKLMDELRDTADKLMYSRRTLIDLTADYNIMVVSFPSNILAKAFKFGPEKGLTTRDTGEHLSVSEKEEASPKVDLK